MSLQEFFPVQKAAETKNYDAGNGSTNGWDALRSRISRYHLVSNEFPQWDEERDEILPSKCYLSGEVIRRPLGR